MSKLRYKEPLNLRSIKSPLSGDVLDQLEENTLHTSTLKYVDFRATFMTTFSAFVFHLHMRMPEVLCSKGVCNFHKEAFYNKEYQ